MRHVNLKLSEAQAFVKRYHRHSKPLKRHMFSIGAYDEFCHYPTTDPVTGGTSLKWPLGIHGIATVDRCSSAWSSDRCRIEIRRVCLSPEAPKNMASYLISKATAACFAMGFAQIVTYTQPHECGASLKACGFRLDDWSVKKYKDGTIEGRLRWVSDCMTLTDKGRQVQKDDLRTIADFVGV